MSGQNEIDYYRIAKAIDYIHKNITNQPNLDEIAKAVHLSPSHFQKLFTNWAGVSPKKFLQYLTINYAKKCLSDKEYTLFDTTHELGLSSTSRLHDLFIKIEGMTPAEYKNGGKNIVINYHFSETIFGNVLVASTQKGICYLAFIKNQEEGLLELYKRFPNAEYVNKETDFHQIALSKFNKENDSLISLPLHLSGTPFQLKVWEALLKIPSGDLTTYGKLAREINHPKASRAVGTAIGSNPVAFLIPCHRVIQSTGKIGGYMWDPVRKQAIIGWEAAKNNTN